MPLFKMPLFKMPLFKMPSFNLFLSLTSVILLQSGLVRGFTQCYYPDGSIPQDYVWEPCVGTGSGAKYSSCCVPSEGDICQENGLCYYPSSSFDGTGSLYRGACTDRTWNDPACNADVCVSGFETTWMWVAKCDAGGKETTVCGTMSDNAHESATCADGAATNTASVRTTRTTSSAGRYTPPPSVDTSVYSVITSTYTTIMTAKAQSTTLTTTFESTFTSAIGKAVVTGTATSAASTSTATDSPIVLVGDQPKKGAVTLSTGILVAIIVGPLLAICISIGIFFYLRKKRSNSQGESIRLNSAGNYPPPNGPVGADQVHPYEVDVNEVSGPKKEFYGYKAPKVETYEIDDRTATMRGEKLAREKLAVATELGVHGHETIMSPAPTYHEAMMPVELDGTSSVRAPSRG